VRKRDAQLAACTCVSKHVAATTTRPHALARTASGGQCLTAGMARGGTVCAFFGSTA
jgi:hypothetical protein